MASGKFVPVAVKMWDVKPAPQPGAVAETGALQFAAEVALPVVQYVTQSGGGLAQYELGS
jgi:hypothetical protein